ncbi:hypothetical protein JW905_18585 [bacterium]|nr:hypothetical protein [candidate division CSSED10-310 bacterium]
MRIRVVVIDSYMPEELRILYRERLDGIAEVEFFRSPPADVLAEAVVIVAWQPLPELVEPASRCVLFQALSAGLGSRHMELLAAHPGITLANLHGNACGVAQHAVALLLAAANRLVYYDAAMRRGEWGIDKDNPASLMLHRMTIGLLGLGAIGIQTARLLAPFGSRLVACTRTGTPRPDSPVQELWPVERLDTFLGVLDAVILALPLTGATRHLLDSRRLSRMKPGAVLVNVSRGGVVEEQALYEALHDGRLGAAGLDVWYEYRPPAVNGKKYPYHYPFHELDNVVLSPHRSASPIFAPDRWEDVFENIRRAAAGTRPFLNEVDLTAGY